MADKLSKFKIKGTLADVIDREARSEIASQSESISEIQSEIDSQSVAYSEMFSEVDDDIATKQEESSAWKIGTISVTEENVTIEPLQPHNFSIPIPANQKNILPLYARSADTTRTLLPMNMYTTTNNINVVMSNQRATAFTNENITIQLTYAYQ